MSVPGVVNYPATLDTAVSLIEAANNAATTLAAPLLAGAASADLTSAATLPASGTLSLLTGEVLVYTGKASNTLTGLVRSREGTTAAASAPAGTGVELRPTARHHTVLADAIIATQAKLGAGASLPASGQFLKGTGAGASGWSALLAADISDALGYTPQDAATAATDAEIAAAIAPVSAAAAAAQSTANTGVANAATAQTTANTGVTNAATAQSTANTALANAAIANAQLGGTAAAGTLLVGTGAGAAAWQATSSLAFVSGQVGVNRAAPGAMLHAVASGAAVKGAIVQGAASQSANLFEVQNSSGTTLAFVGPIGQAQFSPAYTNDTSFQRGLYVAPTITPTANSAIQMRGIETLVTYASGAVGNYSGTGRAILGTLTYLSPGTMSPLYGGQFTVNVGATAGAVALIYGVVANIAHAGPGAATNVRAFESSITATNATGTIGTATGFYAQAPTASGGAGITIAQGIYVANQGVAGVTTSYGIRVANGNSYAILTDGGTVRHDAGAANVVPLNVRGAASQSANLTEWMNSSGTVQAAVGADGSASFGAALQTAYQLYVGRTTTLATADNGLGGVLTIVPASPPAANIVYGGVQVTAQIGSGVAVSMVNATVKGARLYGQHNGNVAAGTILGLDALAQNTSTSGSVVSAEAGRFAYGATVAGASITNGYGVRVLAPGVVGTIGNAYGVHIANQGAANVTTSYGIVVAAQSGSSTASYAIFTNGGRVRFDATGTKLELNDTGLGFFGTAPVAKPAVTGSRGGNAAVAALLTALANLGLITDSTSA